MRFYRPSSNHLNVVSMSNSMEASTLSSISRESVSNNFKVLQNNYGYKPLPKVLFVLGGPGAGKGTQCEKLSNEYGMCHLSAGDLLREEISSGSVDGKLVASIIKDGKIVPVKITLDLIRKKMETTSCNRFLVDGFPRNFDNVQGWNENMQEVCEIEGVMYIDCPESELEKRLLSRGQVSGRTDDNLATVKKRFVTFYESTMPVIDYYEKESKLIKVNGGQSREAVFEEMKKAVVPLVEKEIISLTMLLLQSIKLGDWNQYASYCDASMTSFTENTKVSIRYS